MKYIPFSKIYIILQQVQVTSENKTHGTYKLPNIHDKKEMKWKGSISIIKASS